ncbi:hypothetical protein [Burkholderia pseudomallei]|uniref:hypothetical protein n=1 Tax=Burkholderia pseudomallei TaxID=28450 RepID=UPI000975DBC5|nr:hypothetical protein [Burkholderia pseudomallei]
MTGALKTSAPIIFFPPLKSSRKKFLGKFLNVKICEIRIACKPQKIRRDNLKLQFQRQVELTNKNRTCLARQERLRAAPFRRGAAAPDRRSGKDKP